MLGVPWTLRSASEPFLGLIAALQPFLHSSSLWRTSSSLELYAGRVGEKVQPLAASLPALQHLTLPAPSHLQSPLICLLISAGFPGTTGDHSVAGNTQASHRLRPQTDTGVLAAATC